MNAIEKVQNDCYRATFLIEKSQIIQISFHEEFELKLHLAGCSICRTFQTQSLLINQIAKAMATRLSRPMRLDDEEKNQMRQKLRERI